MLQSPCSPKAKPGGEKVRYFFVSVVPGVSAVGDRVRSAEKALLSPAMRVRCCKGVVRRLSCRQAFSADRRLECPLALGVCASCPRITPATGNGTDSGALRCLMPACFPADRGVDNPRHGCTDPLPSLFLRLIGPGGPVREIPCISNQMEREPLW